MRLVVDGPALGDAAATFLRGNHDAAQLHRNLVSSLSWCGAMAGSSSLSSAFGTAYDDAAPLALSAVASLVDAFAACGHLAASSLRNHAHAESRSVLSGPVVFDGCAMPASYVSVLPSSLPSALGAPASFIPSWAAWVLDQVEGFVWPDADLDLLRSAAAAWRAAAGTCHTLAAYCSSAAASLDLTRSPEIPVAVSVTTSLGATCERVGSQCTELAAACSAYADQVEQHRAAVLDVVRDLLRDAVVIQGVGIVLGTVTAGITAGGAALANAAKIAAAAPRVLRIVGAVRSAASACALPVRVAGDALRGIRLELDVFRLARVEAATARDVDRTAQLARARETVGDPSLFDPYDLEGLTPLQVKKLCHGWPVAKARDWIGWKFQDPINRGRQIRIMEPYPHLKRPDLITEGPYAMVSQNSGKTKIALKGNPTL